MGALGVSSCRGLNVSLLPGQLAASHISIFSRALFLRYKVVLLITMYFLRTKNVSFLHTCVPFLVVHPRMSVLELYRSGEVCFEVCKYYLLLHILIWGLM